MRQWRINRINKCIKIRWSRMTIHSFPPFIKHIGSWRNPEDHIQWIHNNKHAKTRHSWSAKKEWEGNLHFIDISRKIKQFFSKKLKQQNNPLMRVWKWYTYMHFVINLYNPPLTYLAYMNNMNWRKTKPTVQETYVLVNPNQ